MVAESTTESDEFSTRIIRKIFRNHEVGSTLVGVAKKFPGNIIQKSSGFQIDLGAATGGWIIISTSSGRISPFKNAQAYITT